MWVPGDAACSGNATPEIDFYSRDHLGNALRWRYVATNGGVARESLDASARAATASETEPALVDLSARCLTAAQTPLAQGGGAAPPDVALALDTAAPQPIGGNRVVELTLHSATQTRVLRLLPGTMPSGFTVIGAPVYHAVIYRVDQTGRFLIGLGQSSHVWIEGRVDVSFDGWKTSVPWCEGLVIYGGAHGLDGTRR